MTGKILGTCLMAENSEVQSVQRAVRILLALIEESDNTSSPRDGKSVKSLSTATKLPVSTTHRLLRTLVECHLVEQDSVTEKYRLGPVAGVLGQSYRNMANLARVEELLEDLSHKTQESVSLATLHDHSAIVISHVESDQILRVDYSLGTSLAMHASAMGKALLAFTNGDLSEVIRDLGSLQSFTDKTIVDPLVLRDELLKARKNGYATNFGERFDGAHGVAVPIYATDNSTCRFALGIQGPSTRITKKKSADLAKQCAITAAQITALNLLY